MSGDDAGAAVVTAYLDAVGSLDVDAVVATFHPDIVVHIPYAPPGIPTVVEGKAAATDWFAGLPGLLAPMNFAGYDVQPLVAEGEYVAEYTSDSKVLTTGLPYANSYISRFTIRDGLIVRLAEHFDSVALVKALGGTVEMPSA
ncbi:MAG: nuclear transport factor 2 family protein [Pseudonocardiaceae bacterium]|nr:MAG: nuclear transport factor 2 family protein [Pseudonocardiaceae bacterium]